MTRIEPKTRGQALMLAIEQAGTSQIALAVKTQLSNTDINRIVKDRNPDVSPEVEGKIEDALSLERGTLRYYAGKAARLAKAASIPCAMLAIVMLSGCSGTSLGGAAIAAMVVVATGCRGYQPA